MSFSSSFLGAPADCGSFGSLVAAVLADVNKRSTADCLRQLSTLGRLPHLALKSPIPLAFKEAF